MHMEGLDATLTALCAAGTTGIFIISCIWGVNAGLSRMDTFCAAIGIGTVLVGFVTNDPLVTIIGCVGANSIAALPTLVATWKDPRNEPLVAWLLWVVGSIIFLSALQQDELGTQATSIAIVLEEGAVVVVILWQTRSSTFLSKIRAFL